MGENAVGVNGDFSSGGGALGWKERRHRKQARRKQARRKQARWKQARRKQARRERDE